MRSGNLDVITHSPVIRRRDGLPSTRQLLALLSGDLVDLSEQGSSAGVRTGRPCPIRYPSRSVCPLVRRLGADRARRDADVQALAAYVAGLHTTR
jgi:hypothetical protein